MRKRIILSLISIFAFVFFSCSGLLNDIDENSSSNKAYVQIGDTSSRTVLPAALNTDAMTDIELIGDKAGGSSNLSLLSANKYSELTGKTAEIEAGTWSFELQAKINGKTFTDSTSCTNIEVSAGDTLRLTFSAMEAGEEGNFYVKVNYEERQELSSVKVFLGDDLVYDSNVLSETESDVTVSWTKSSAIVSGPVSSGDHKLKIEFYDGNSLWHTFREIIRVKGGLSSEREYTITLNTPPSKLLADQSRNLYYALRTELKIGEAKAFKPATSAPANDITTYTLDEDLGAVAWKADNGTIYYYNPSSTTKISLGSDANRLFDGCSAITEINLSGFDTSNVIDMGMMFNDCAVLTSLDLSNFDTSNVRNMADMFFGCAALETIYTASDADWNSESVDSYNMFEGCTKLVGGKGTTYDSNYNNATYARVDSNSNPGYFTVFGTEKTLGISVNTIVGGTVTVSAEDAKAGTVITLTAAAKAGYEFGEWNLRDANGEYVPVEDDNTFIMPASKVTVNATFYVSSITAALAEGAELKITFNTTKGTSTVKFTRQDGSYNYTRDVNPPEDVHISEEDGIINIDGYWTVEDMTNGEIAYSREDYFLTINTNESTYTESGSAVLQTIKVNGTEVTLTKSN